MSSNDQKNDRADTRLDDALRALRDSGPTPEETRAASERAWATIQARSQAAADASRGPACDTVRGEIADFVAGRLSDSRAGLIGDHCRECLHCRRAVKLEREGMPAAPLVPSTPSGPNWTRRLALAAGFVLPAVLAGYFAVSGILSPANGSIRIVDINGTLLSPDGPDAVALQEGQVLDLIVCGNDNDDSAHGGLQVEPIA